MNSKTIAIEKCCRLAQEIQVELLLHNEQYSEKDVSKMYLALIQNYNKLKDDAAKTNQTS